MSQQARELVCIVCPKGCRLRVEQDGQELKVTGNLCRRGEGYGRAEVTNPVRTLTSTVRIENSAYGRCPVKTAAPVPKDALACIMQELSGVTLKPPVLRGQAVLSDVCGTGVDIIATRDMPPAGQ